MSAPRSTMPAALSPDVTHRESTPPVVGRRHRARSADPLRSRTRSSDRLSSTTTIATTTTTTTASSCSSIHRDWNPDRTSHSCPEAGSFSRCHLHAKDSRGHVNNGHSPDSAHFHNQRLYHSDFNIHHHYPHHHHHHHHNHHHHHHHHHHHQHHDDDEDAPRRRRRRGRRRFDHHASSASLPSSSDSASRGSSQPERGSPGSRDTLNLSLCGCGFLGVYHLGVVSCLLKYGPSFLAKVDRVAGASAGALAAAVLVTSPTLRQVETSTEMVSVMAKKVRRKPLGALTPGYRLAKELERLLDRVLPPDAHLLASGKLHVSLTDVKTKENVVVSEFESREELIQALVASCHIPVYSGLKYPSVSGKHYCDGGLSNNLIQFRDGRTVTVSPFSGQQDIGPRDALKKGTKGCFFNLHNQDLQASLNNIRRVSHALFPPSSAILQHYFELGHKDASRFLVREGLYEIPRPPEKPPVMYESSV